LVKLPGAAVGEEDEQHDVRNAFSSKWPGCVLSVCCLVLPAWYCQVGASACLVPQHASHTVQPSRAAPNHTTPAHLQDAVPPSPRPLVQASCVDSWACWRSWPRCWASGPT
jgi:hypothetical protein